MDEKQKIIDLYQKGYSISYITKKTYEKRNLGYYYAFKKINSLTEKDVLEDCRKLVEKTILEHQTKQRRKSL